MKKVVLHILFLVALQTSVNAQCFIDRHSTAWFDGWLSCEIAENPNTTRGESHWILYDFGSLMEMYELHIWNVNAPDYLDYGIQTAHIDYSADGINWTEYGEVSLNQGTGENSYEGQELFNFNGKEAKYLLITANTTYGSNCAGFAELKLAVDSVDVPDPIDTTSTDNPVDSICIIADVYPNPMATNELYITLKQQCVPAVHYTVTDAMGRVIVQSTPIALDETVEVLKGKELASGVYIVELTSNYAKSEYKIVRQ